MHPNGRTYSPSRSSPGPAFPKRPDIPESGLRTRDSHLPSPRLPDLVPGIGRSLRVRGPDEHLVTLKDICHCRFDDRDEDETQQRETAPDDDEQLIGHFVTDEGVESVEHGAANPVGGD